MFFQSTLRLERQWAFGSTGPLTESLIEKLKISLWITSMDLKDLETRRTLPCLTVLFQLGLHEQKHLISCLFFNIFVIE